MHWSYVHSLMQRLDRLKSVQTTVTGNNDDLAPLMIPPSQSTVLELDPGLQDATGDPPAVSFDKHFIVENSNPTCWQFFGSSSAYALAVEVLINAISRFGPITHQEHYTGTEFALNAQAKSEADLTAYRKPASRSEVELLVAFYLATTNILLPFVDVETVAGDIDAYFNLQGFNARALTGKEAHQYFRLTMMCAVAAANKARHQRSFHTESMHYYADALQCVEEVTSDVSADALVALLLLINFACFYPRKGDVWKLLDFACRLSVELNYHTEPNDAFEDERSRKRRRSIFWGLYLLERTIGQHYGRPSDLTEDIITAEYPATLNAMSLSDPAEFQYVLTSHYYRLCYLRSEIFRDLYMPARSPHFPQIWYQQRFESILSWQRELQFLDNVLGMGSLSCDIGYESSVCFLFQPLLLRSLVATKDPGQVAADAPQSIPKESYVSAVQIIEFYKKIFRASEHAPYGMYPVTIISTHYIYLGVMTIMAHCLLALDGRLPVNSYASISVFNTTPQEIAENGRIDFSNIHEVSGSCLIVLSRIAESYPGMIGMLDIYKSLSEKVIPMMIRRGLG